VPPLPLETTLHAISPRYSPPRRPWRGSLIWIAGMVLFAALFAQGFVRMGVAAWAVGLVYILYDTALLAFTAMKTWRIDDRPASLPAPSTIRPTLAVIVAAYNESRVLAATVAALAAQSDPPDLVLVADDGSDDATALVMPDLESESVRWLRLPRGGKARALNAALEAIDADIVVTVDADTLLDADALAAMRAAFAADPALVAATGVLTPVCAQGVSGGIFGWFQRYEYVRNFLSRYAWAEKNSLLLVSGAFAGFRRTALVEVGGFDPDCLVEDYEILHRLHRFSADRGLGWRVRVLGDARATTDAPAALMPFLRQRRRWFAGFLQTQLWNRDMIGNARYGALGTAMLPVKALDTVQPLYGLAAFALLIVFATTGTIAIVWPVIVAMAVKVAIDLAYLLWSLRLYRRWTGIRLSPWGAIAAAIVEPLTFQLLRHAGAAWGWWVFLTGQQVWGANVRSAPVLPANDRSVAETG
jgi:cellulose synthase/poly-beta-1,6-N-acetylglucosamine synthase-like glycosyltransferase